MAKSSTSFQPGASGNPSGRRPKGEATAELLRAIGDLTYPGTKKTYRERAAQVIWEQAARGSLQALAWITDRTDGKVTDRLDATVSQETVLRLRPRWTDDDALAGEAAPPAPSLPPPASPPSPPGDG